MTVKRRRIGYLPLLALLSVMMLGGCLEAQLYSAYDILNREVFNREDVSLVEKNNAAADYIITQAQDFIDNRDIIRMETLINQDEAGLSSAIAKTIPVQIGTRFSQLGYSVDLSRVLAQGEHHSAVGMQDAAGKTAKFITGGTYRRHRGHLYVGLKITEIGSGRVIGAFDYRMPISREIDDLSKPKATIIQIN